MARGGRRGEPVAKASCELGGVDPIARAQLEHQQRRQGLDAFLVHPLLVHAPRVTDYPPVETPPPPAEDTDSLDLFSLVRGLDDC